MTVKTYDPSNVIIIVGGASASGYADGTFIEIAADDKRFNKTVGADGEVSRAKSNNRSATVTLTLTQTSGFNDVLSSYEALDQLSNSGVVPFMLKDLNGTTLISSESCWVEEVPSLTYSKEIEERQWMLSLGETNWFAGGVLSSALINP